MGQIEREYRQCNRCVMDTTDKEIVFDSNGHCNHCSDYFSHSKIPISITEKNIQQFFHLIEEIKLKGKNRKYDCIVGVSGGIDSAYLVYKMVEMGLRPLAIHVDNGWNSEIAVSNLEKILTCLKVDLYTYVIDWEEFKDLQLSFLKAGVVDIELLTDQAISAVLNKLSIKFNTKYIFHGVNSSSESILPKSWIHWKHDVLNIKSIHSKFGKIKLKTYPFLTYFQEYWHIKFRKTKHILALDYLNYNKSEAEKVLQEKFDWKDYGDKHHESVFTRFYQSYILPVKFNIDKRKAHLSSLICSGQITREEAVAELKFEPWKSNKTIEDKQFVIKKLDVTMQEFDNWMKEKPVSHFNYSSYLTKHDRIVKNIKKFFGRK